MSYALAPGYSFGIHDGHAVVLDLYGDRYFRLSRSLTELLLDISSRDPTPCSNDLSALLNCGLIAEASVGTRIAPVASLPATVSALESRQPHARGVIRFWRVAAAVCAVRFGLAANGFSATVDRVRRAHRRTALRSDAEQAVAIAQTFMRHRAGVPFNRACVLDSLALSRLLTRASVDHDVVFGVRLDPFAAHAWVQTGSIILSDKLDPIAEFTPVFRL